MLLDLRTALPWLAWSLGSCFIALDLGFPYCEMWQIITTLYTSKHRYYDQILHSYITVCLKLLKHNVHNKGSLLWWCSILITLLKHCNHLLRWKTPGCQKILILIFFQNYTNGLWYVPGLELENVCQNSNTLYCLVLLAFAAESRVPGEAVFSNSGTHYLPEGKWEGLSLAGESAWDHLLVCPWKGGVFRVCVVQCDCREKHKSVFQACEYTSFIDFPQYWPNILVL